MKTRIILFSVLALCMAMFISSCSDDEVMDVEATGIFIDSTDFNLEVGTTALITATLDPVGAVGEITWSSSEPSVAAVNNGVVTALSEGTTTIAAVSGPFSAMCEVTVVPEPIDLGDFPSLSGSNYTVIQIDEQSATLLGDKIINDCRPDDDTRNLFIWPDGTSFTAGTSTGTNFYGQTEGWVSLVVGTVGWSGAGYFLSADAELVDMTDISSNPDDYVFHIGLKSSQENTSYVFIFSDGISEAKICVGSTTFVDGDLSYEPYADFTRDGEWHSIEIPATKLRELGVFYNEPFNDKSVFSFLAGGVTGTTLDFDAAFFYKKP